MKEWAMEHPFLFAMLVSFALVIVHDTIVHILNAMTGRDDGDEGGDE